MNPLRPMLLAAALAIGPALASSAFAQPVFFYAKDGVKIYGDFRRAEGSSRGTILLLPTQFPMWRQRLPMAACSMQHAGPNAVWGSSYSSALVFVVAARHPEVKALLAFSPAKYIQGYSIEKAAAKLSIPVFITSAPDGGEISSGEALAKAVPDHRAVQYIPEDGVHGSSTLQTDEDPRGASENWKHVMAFLDSAFPRA